MKKLKIRIIAFILLLVLFYLISAFIEISFDITKWEKGTRTFVGIFGTFIAFLIACAPYPLSDD